MLSERFTPMSCTPLCLCGRFQAVRIRITLKPLAWQIYELYIALVLAGTDSLKDIQLELTFTSSTTTVCRFLEECKVNINLLALVHYRNHYIFLPLLFYSWKGNWGWLLRPCLRLVLWCVLVDQITSRQGGSVTFDRFPDFFEGKVYSQINEMAFSDLLNKNCQISLCNLLKNAKEDDWKLWRAAAFVSAVVTSFCKSCFLLLFSPSNKT